LLNYWRDFFAVPLRTTDTFPSTEPAVLPQVCDHVELDDGRSLLLFEEAGPLAEQLWHQRQAPPLLATSAEHQGAGRENLRRMGVPTDAWFVTLHVRDLGFYGKRCDPGRCSDILTYLPAVRLIHQHGGWVVRIGDPRMKPLPQCPGLIDYPRSAFKSDWMDIFLMSQCRFFMGTNSGPSFVPPLFGVPCLYTNWFPFSLCPFYPDNLLLPKLYWHEGQRRHLTFAEMLPLPLRHSFHPGSLSQLGLRLRDNTPEELQAAVAQMLARTQGAPPPDPPDEGRQQRLAALLRPYPWAWSLRVGSDFLRDHQRLLP
jgi:putative glycosyltransferase (TIGR04372 family)